MKIDPAERIPQFPPQSADNAKKKQAPGGFDEVLQQTLHKTGQSGECLGPAIRSMKGPQAPIAVSAGPEGAVETMALKLIDRLEDYQKLLSDPDITLKQIQPVMEQLEKQADGSRALMSDMPEGHPLRAIVQDVVANIDQEVARFNAGYYVDD
jgi:hypothetical protein